MSRRTTLGPLSTNTSRLSMGGDGRKSLAPGRISFGGGGAAPSRRASMASGRPSLGGRMSIGGGRPSIGGGRPSIGGGRPSMGTGRPSMGGGGRPSKGRTSTGRPGTMYGRSSKQDPRPISDRGYMRASTETLITYLADHQYDHAISVKIVKQPTAKDFNNIINFLFRCVDPNFENKGKLQDVVTTMFKNLRYPFGISKTGLVAVGSPHTWPALLASMSWLIELLSYDETVQRDGNSGGDDMEKNFAEYLGSAYHCFLSGDDEQFNALKEEFEGTFQDRNEQIREAISNLETEQVDIKTEIERLGNAPTKADWTRKRADYKSDQEKLINLIDKIQKKTHALERKLGERRSELLTKEEELDQILAENSRLTTRVAEQELSAQDVMQMRASAARTAEGLATTRTRAEALRQEIWEKEAEIGREMESLSSSVASFNQTTVNLKLWPPSAPHARGRDLELSLRMQRSGGAGSESGAAPGEDLLVVGAQTGRAATSSALTMLQEVRGEMVSACVELHAATEEVGVEVEGLSEVLGEGRKAVEEAEVRVRRQAEDMERAKQEMEAQSAARTAQVEALELKIQEQNQSKGGGSGVDLVAELVRVEKETAGVRQSMVAQQAEFESRQAALSTAVLGALDALTQHKETVQDALVGVEAHANARVAEMDAVGQNLLSQP